MKYHSSYTAVSSSYIIIATYRLEFVCIEVNCFVCVGNGTEILKTGIIDTIHLQMSLHNTIPNQFISRVDPSIMYSQ